MGRGTCLYFLSLVAPEPFFFFPFSLLGYTLKLLMLATAVGSIVAFRNHMHPLYCSLTDNERLAIAKGKPF